MADEKLDFYRGAFVLQFIEELLDFLRKTTESIPASSELVLIHDDYVIPYQVDLVPQAEGDTRVTVWFTEKECMMTVLGFIILEVMLTRCRLGTIKRTGNDISITNNRLQFTF